MFTWKAVAFALEGYEALLRLTRVVPRTMPHHPATQRRLAPMDTTTAPTFDLGPQAPLYDRKRLNLQTETAARDVRETRWRYLGTLDG